MVFSPLKPDDLRMLNTDFGWIFAISSADVLKLSFFFNAKTKPIFVDNYKWLKGLKYISFLRDIGKHFTINKNAYL